MNRNEWNEYMRKKRADDERKKVNKPQWRGSTREAIKDRVMAGGENLRAGAKDMVKGIHGGRRRGKPKDITSLFGW